MAIPLPEIPVAERTPLVESLLAIIQAQHDQIRKLEETVRQLRDEIALLKGLKPRPPIAPSRLESPPAAPRSEGDKRPGSAKRPKNGQLVITEEITLSVPDPPPGSVSKGYEPYVVQELVLKAQATRYWRQRILTPDGRRLLAPLPPTVIAGRHFGSTLISFMLHQHHHCRVTQPLLWEQLRELGLDISSGQVNRILTEGLEVFHREKAALLPAGLAASAYVGVDDTGARHQGKNGYCTVIGNDLFAYFESTGSKSRLNFLEVLRGTRTDYAITDEAVAYWERQHLSADRVQALREGLSTFADAAAWQARLQELKIASPRHVRIATEGALVGSLIASGVRPDLVVLSDGAPQFDILVHASCWIHAERPLVKMVPCDEKHRTVIERLRNIIWELYRDLKAYRQRPEAARKPALEARFDALCAERTGYPSLTSVLAEMTAHRADLLRVLERPEVPLHNNTSESHIREYVTKRKISGSTRSEAGRRCRDTFASLKKTCRRLGVRFWDYLRDRLGGLGGVPQLADKLRQRAGRAGEGQDAVPVPVSG